MIQTIDPIKTGSDQRGSMYLYQDFPIRRAELTLYLVVPASMGERKHDVGARTIH
jgi:hypothetical protein